MYPWLTACRRISFWRRPRLPHKARPSHLSRVRRMAIRYEPWWRVSTLRTYKSTIKGLTQSAIAGKARNAIAPRRLDRGAVAESRLREHRPSPLTSSRAPPCWVRH